MAEESKIKIVIDTSLGQISAELFCDEAPITTENFLAYIEEGFYDGLIFHRVIDNFMIQGGGFDAELEHKAPTRSPIKIESDNGLKNVKGTLAMARTSDPNSATSQFFINLVDNDYLNYKSEANPGYAVFGLVTLGMDIVEKIGKVQTGVMHFMKDVPTETVMINSIKVVK